MNKKTILVNAAMAGLFSANLFAADDAGKKAAQTPEKAAPVKCTYKNTCHGKGNCKGAKNDCAGKNTCGGHEWMAPTAKACTDKGGTV